MRGKEIPYATTQNMSSILSFNVANAPRKNIIIIIAQEKCPQKKNIYIYI
jgi:hypothetical protein